MPNWDDFVRQRTDIDSQYDNETFEDSNDTFWDMYNAEREDDNQVEDDND